MASPTDGACADLSNSNNVLAELENDLRFLGFAGPADLPKLIYLVMQTRLSPKPVSLVIKGPSGSGKSFALSQVLKFIPQKNYEYFSGMSEKAILYSGLNLKNKHLVIGEAAGLAAGDGRAFLRQLLSEGEIKYMTVQKTDKGLTGTQLPAIEGPTGLIMTTTANALHPEDESRMLSLNMPESAEQIRLALLAMADQTKVEKPIDFSRWHEFDDRISEGCTKVIVPFARRIAEALPLTHMRVQRDFPQLLALVSSHALLHKCNRSTNDDGTIIAKLEDYDAVYHLVNKPFSEGLETAVPENIRRLVDAVSELGGAEPQRYAFDGCITQRMLADKVGRDHSAVSRALSAAITQGYLQDLNPGQGKQSSIVLGERELPRGYALPTLEYLTT